MNCVISGLPTNLGNISLIIPVRQFTERVKLGRSLTFSVCAISSSRCWYKAIPWKSNVALQHHFLFLNRSIALPPWSVNEDSIQANFEERSDMDWDCWSFLEELLLDLCLHCCTDSSLWTLKPCCITSQINPHYVYACAPPHSCTVRKNPISKFRIQFIPYCVNYYPNNLLFLFT